MDTDQDLAPRERGARVDLSRTWELELFISGATVFALLQAPRFVDRWYAHAQPHLAGGSDLFAFFAYYYAKLILYTLIATFVLHLITRAYWVALVGVHSVYPHGIRWSELKLGPAFLEVYKAKLPSLEQAIRRVDDLSSLLFSGGAVVLLTFFGSILLIGPVALLAALVSKLFFGGMHADTIVIAIVFVVASVPVVARLLDTRAEKRGDLTPSKGLRRIALVSWYLGATPVLGPPSMVMSSNMGRRSAAVAMTIVFLLIVGTFIIKDVLLPRDSIRMDSHVYLDDGVAAQELRPEHYADQRRDGEVHAQTPFIQSAIIDGPYLQLFVPITPERHNALIEERCPQLEPRAGGLRFVSPLRRTQLPDAQPFIDCVSAFQPVSLNGTPLTEATWRLATDPATRVRGILTLIPVADLAAGEHVLRVEGLPRPTTERDARRQRPARAPHLIRFWR